MGGLDLTLGSANVLFSCIRISQLRICCAGKSAGQFGNTESLYVTEIKSLQLKCVGSQGSNWRITSLSQTTRIYRNLCYSAVGCVFFLCCFFFFFFCFLMKLCSPTIWSIETEVLIMGYCIRACWKLWCAKHQSGNQSQKSSELLYRLFSFTVMSPLS